jgi:hypothetical protein
MTNDKCSMINDQGFALITVLFILVSAISAVLVCAYPLVSEPRDHALSYITNMKFQRYKRALLGRLADQCGGKFMSCGGLVSDYPQGGGAAAAGVIVTRPYGLRHFRCLGTDSGVMSPDPFQYHNDCSFWRGYNGKRYVYPLPSDDWTDDRHMFSGAFTDADGMPFWFYYGCAQSWRLKTTGAVGTKTLGICFNASTYTYIMVRDYTKAKYEDLKVILVGSVSNSPEDLQIPDKEYKDHILHTFKFQTVPDGNARSKGLFYYAGLNKLLIQLKENGEWITKSAPGIVIPPWSSCDSPEHTYRGSSCITVDYYG